MDSTPKNSIYQDRQFFLSQLKSNPLFLLSHLPALSAVLWKRYRTKYLTALRGPHKGSKKRPAWLKPLGMLGKTHVTWKTVLKRIPERRLVLAPLPAALDIAHETRHAEPDAEDVFAAHRFGELMITVLDKGEVPHTLPPAITHWLTHMPHQQEAAWETYSSCERVANLLTWITFIPRDKRDALPAFITDFLQHSLQWIYAHLEWYDQQTGNHILNNARALIMLGAVLDNAKAVQAGMLILRHMLPVLIQPQGALRERSTHYQLIILTWLLDAYYFAQSTGLYLEEELAFLTQTIQAMCQTAALFCDTQGYLQTCIGDISPDASPLTTVRRLLACYPEQWPLSQQTITSRDDWYVLQTKDNKILLNCPKGDYPHAFPSHAHGDISSFVWIHQDEPLLIDTGRARYTKDRFSLLQKSAIGHNIPLVNHFAPLCESLVLHGHWWPLPYARATIGIAENAEQTIALTHDGFKRSTPVTQHTRSITLLQDAVQIQDHFQGKGQAHIRLLWQLHPDFNQFDHQTLTLCNDNKRITLDVNATGTTPTIQYFHQHPDVGWCSSQYGYMRSNPVLSIQWQVTLPFTATLIFRIQPCAV